jgi:hypothetical protein
MYIQYILNLWCNPEVFTISSLNITAEQNSLANLCVLMKCVDFIKNISSFFQNTRNKLLVLYSIISNIINNLLFGTNWIACSEFSAFVSPNRYYLKTKTDENRSFSYSIERNDGRIFY